MSFFKEAPFCSWALYRYAATLAGGLRAFGKEERGSRLPKRQVGWSGGLQVWEDAAVSAGSGFGLPFSMAAPCGTAYCSPVVSACSHEIIFSKHLTLNYRPSLAGWKQLTHCIYLDQLKKKKNPNLSWYQQLIFIKPNTFTVPWLGIWPWREDGVFPYLFTDSSFHCFTVTEGWRSVTGLLLSTLTGKMMGSNWPSEKNLIKTKTTGTMKNKKPNIAAVYTALLLEIISKRIFVSI